MNSSKQVRRLGFGIVAATVVFLLFLGARFFSSERKAVMPPVSNSTITATADVPAVMEFADVALPEAASRFAKASGVEITVAPEVAQFRIGGKIKVGEVDAFLHMLSQTFPVRVDVEREKRFRVRSK